MAANLRAKIPEKDTLLINDRNDAATKSFVDDVEAGTNGLRGSVVVVEDARELAERSVSSFPPPAARKPPHSAPTSASVMICIPIPYDLSLGASAPPMIFTTPKPIL
jgi:hypothetical protein